MARPSILTNEEIYDLLVMRKDGFSYRGIGERLGISEGRVSMKYNSMLANFNEGYLTRCQEVAKAAGVSFSEVVYLLKCKINYCQTREKGSLMIKINGEGIPPNIWYNSKKGRVFSATTNGTYYMVEGKPLFKVHHNHCTIYHPNQNKATQ